MTACAMRCATSNRCLPATSPRCSSASTISCVSTIPSSGMFKEPGLVAEMIGLQVRHWDLITEGRFDAAYTESAERIFAFGRRCGLAPQWSIGSRMLFLVRPVAEAGRAGDRRAALWPRREGGPRPQDRDARRADQGHRVRDRNRGRDLFRRRAGARARKRSNRPARAFMPPSTSCSAHPANSRRPRAR